MMTPTPHNKAKKGEIAKTVLMPGDPLRAKYIAEKYLTDVTMYNDVRNMFGFTGKYKGKEISIQGSGMGVPSMGIYSRELFEAYDVDNIIRIGSAGALANDEASEEAKGINLRDVLVATSVATDSNYLQSNNMDEEYYPVVSDNILEVVQQVTKENSIDVKYGEIFTSDVFYKDRQGLIECSKLGVIGVEMETLALYANAKITNKNALAMFTVSDNPILGESISSEERQIGFDKMIELALEVAYRL